MTILIKVSALHDGALHWYFDSLYLQSWDLYSAVSNHALNHGGGGGSCIKVTTDKLAFLSFGFKEEWLVMDFIYSTLVKYDKMQLETYSKSSYMLSRHIQVWFRLSRSFMWTRTSTQNSSLASNHRSHHSVQSSSYSMKKSWWETIKIHIHLKSHFRALSNTYCMCMCNGVSLTEI